MYRKPGSGYTFFTNCFVFVIPSPFDKLRVNSVKRSRGICLYYRYLVRRLADLYDNLSVIGRRLLVISYFSRGGEIGRRTLVKLHMPPWRNW